MEFRKAVKEDIGSIMNIISQAQEYLKENGINQWQNGYPNTETIMDDISQETSYVLLKEDNIVGTAAVSFDGEKTYKNIYEGQWITRDDYAVVHRVAVRRDCKGKGLASIIFKFIGDICLNMGIYSIRIDTHKQNKSMQKLLQKNGFQYCGIIYLEDRSERIAFEKMLKKENSI